MKSSFALIILLAWSSNVLAAETNYPTRAENLARVRTCLEKYQRKYADNSRYFVRRGLLADREKKFITIQAEATGVDEEEIIEFFLIDDTSGHDYEALAIAFARPGDVQAALEFIGLEPGRPASPRTQSFWPRGERVIMKINGVRAEQYVLQHDTGKPSPERGLVFTGGMMIPDPDNPGKTVYAADAREPNSIASNYNEPESVLDIPRRAPQKTVYGNNVMNPALVMPEGKFIEIAIEPEYRDGKKRVLDLPVQISRQKTVGRGQGPGIKCRIDGKEFNTEELLEHFEELLEGGRDPFVTLKFDDDVPLVKIRDFCKKLSLLDTDDGIRIEAPAKGSLYYQAYFPPEYFLNRKERIDQPLELSLENKKDRLEGKLVRFITNWPEGKLEPEISEESYAVKSPAELRKTLDSIKSDIPAILVHAPSGLTHGELMGFIKTALTTHPLVHVFIREE